MSQTSFESAALEESQVQARDTDHSSQQEDLFSEALYSGKELEGLFGSKQKREDMHGKKSTKKKAGANGLLKTDPLTLMKERVGIYNKKNDSEYQLTVNEEDISFSGYLTFTHHNGYQTLSERVKLTSTCTAADVLPILLRTFLPSYDTLTDTQSSHSSHIMFSQGGTDRELECTERPLEIALDYSTKGLPAPSFSLRTSVPLLLTSISSPQRRMNSKHSSLSLQASSLSSLGHTSSDSDSPKVSSPQIMYEDHDSLYSYSSTGSMAGAQSGSNGGSKSPFLKSHSRSKSRTHPKQAQQKLSTFDHKLSDPVLSVSASPVHQQLTPEMSRKGLTKNKSKVGNFMEGVARSLKSSKKKIRPPSIYPENNINTDPKKMPLVSPKLAEKRFAVPTVFHIYFLKAKNTQLYKSVLVAEESTTREIIKQALERYGMKYMSPDSFNLYEVIGRWDQVSRGEMFESALERSVVVPIQDDEAKQSSGGQKASNFEEFIECYNRKLGYEEKPYQVQFFHKPPDEYTRRFELRPVVSDEEDTLTGGGSVSGYDQFTPTTPLFGSTSHLHNGQRSRSKSQDTFEFLTETDDGSSVVGGTEGMAKLKDSMRLGLSHSLVDCSSPETIDILTPMQHHPQTDTSSSSVNPMGVFLLNLQLVPSKHSEFTIYNILSEELMVKNRNLLSSPMAQPLYHNTKSEINIDSAGNPPGATLCTIQKTKEHTYTIEPSSSCEVSLNGTCIHTKCDLHHGDLIKIGHTHLLMFQNQNSVSSNSASWPFKWTPIATTASTTDSTSTSVVTEQSKPVLAPLQVSTTNVIDEVHSPHSVSPKVVFISTREEICSLPTLQEVDGTDHVDTADQVHRRRDRSYSDTHAVNKKKRNSRTSNNHPRPRPQTKTSGHINNEANTVGAFPADRKLIFSYNMAEEETLLELLINELDPTKVAFSLSPAYVLGMCMEYSMRYSGASTASRLACRAVEKIQGKVDKITEQMASWQPKTTESTQYPLINEVHTPLYSVLFWLSNTLEFYNFLLIQDSLDFTIVLEGENGETSEDNAMTVLEKIMEHLFQQVFYSISKVLYTVLPRMLEETDADRSSCVHYVVDFLKRTLELMFELHIHTDMVAQIFTTIFFFLNVSMFNVLIDKGPSLDLFEYHSGIKFRTKLDILENWAGREGFRDGPLQYFAVFSSAVDLLATPPEELLSLSWSTLREEFPALLPSQLEFILTHYLLPESCEQCPIHWTPSPENGASNINEDSVRESFESHPQFEIPIGGYLLNLDSQSCDNHMLHEFVDALRKDLRKKQKSVNIVGIKKKSSRPPSIPTMVYSANTYPPRMSGGRRRLDIGQIVTNSNNTDYTNRNDKSPNGGRSSPSSFPPTHNHQEPHHNDVSNNTSTECTNKLRGRVKSIVEPLFTAPEKLTIVMNVEKHDEENEEGQLMEGAGEGKGILSNGDAETGSKDTRTLSLQRGNRGFGFNTETRKDPVTGVDRVIVSSLTAHDGGLENLIDIHPGDQILSVDDRQLPCHEIHQYIKDAEEEISLTVCSGK